MILAHAKLTVMRFAQDLKNCLATERFRLLYMGKCMICLHDEINFLSDTDSLMMGLGATDLDSLVKPDKESQNLWRVMKDRWFVKNQSDKTPGWLITFFSYFKFHIICLIISLTVLRLAEN